MASPNFLQHMFDCSCSCEAALRWTFWLLFTGAWVILLAIMYITDVPVADPSSPSSVVFAAISIAVGSVGIDGLWLYPWFLPCSKYTWFEKLEKATFNWLALSTFEEIFFQIPHNVMEHYISGQQGSGSAVEWPFFVYGVCDSRWNNYPDDGGLAWEIYTNNMLEGTGGLVTVLILLLEKYYWKLSARVHYTSDTVQGIAEHVSDERRRYPHSLALIIMVLFRDGMLFRQTFSYFTDQHMDGYPFSFGGEQASAAFSIEDDDIDASTLRFLEVMGIGGLYFINALWIVAPLGSMVWAWIELTSRDMLEKKERETTGGYESKFGNGSPRE